MVNSEFVVERQQKTGSDYGTPITTPVLHSVVGWFDEAYIQNRVLASDRGTAVPTVKRTALFAVAVGTDLEHYDEGEILIEGGSQGKWRVVKIETVAIPGGMSHLESLLEKLEEGR